MLQSAIKMKTPFVALYLCIVKPRMRAHTYIYYCMETKNKNPLTTNRSQGNSKIMILGK